MFYDELPYFANVANVLTRSLCPNAYKRKHPAKCGRKRTDAD